MSQDYFAWAWKHSDVKEPARRQILMSIADQANDEGFAFDLSISKISEVAGTGINTTKRHIEVLMSSGLLAKAASDGKANSYEILVKVEITTQPKMGEVKTTQPKNFPQKWAGSDLSIKNLSIKDVNCESVETSVSEKPSETIIPGNPLVKTFDPDEVEKPQKRKNQNPNSRVSLLEPQTKGERILFGTLQAEIIKLHGPGWKVPTRFPSFACKELFAECEARLNGGLSSAINAGIQKGIRKVDNLVRYVNAVQPKEQPNSGARVTA